MLLGEGCTLGGSVDLQVGGFVWLRTPGTNAHLAVVTITGPPRCHQWE